MTKKTNFNKKRHPRKYIIVFIIVFSLFFIRTSHNFNFRNVPSVVEAGNLSESILLISEKSPVNVAFQHEKALIEAEKIEKAQLELEKEREIAEKKRQEAQEAKENKKIAYLTFDDGPSPNVTPQILDILDEYDVKATFFVIGNLAEKYPDIIKRINESGHGIGNHSYSHSYKNIYKNTTNFLNELKATDKVLKNILGDSFESNIIRFPGGSFGQQKAPFRKAAIDNGYSYYDWNALNGDAEGKKLSKNKLVQRLKSTTNGQKKLIVLMHDMGGKQTTVDALPEIIEYLQQNGYEFGIIK
ncbi:MAG: polysaccharide deacetylase [Tissierellia bacterium]|nr:polysaccharide deacetylase [Tissierellia bacterium]